MSTFCLVAEKVVRLPFLSNQTNHAEYPIASVWKLFIFVLWLFVCLALTEANAVTRGNETVKGLRPELVIKPGSQRMMVWPQNNAGNGCSFFLLLLSLNWIELLAGPYIVSDIVFSPIFLGRDAKALQEKAARKAAQAGGGNKAGVVGKK